MKRSNTSLRLHFLPRKSNQLSEQNFVIVCQQFVIVFSRKCGSEVSLIWMCDVSLYEVSNRDEFMFGVRTQFNKLRKPIRHPHLLFVAPPDDCYCIVRLRHHRLQEWSLIAANICLSRIGYTGRPRAYRPILVVLVVVDIMRPHRM